MAPSSINVAGTCLFGDVALPHFAVVVVGDGCVVVCWLGLMTWCCHIVLAVFGGAVLIVAGVVVLCGGW